MKRLLLKFRLSVLVTGLFVALPMVILAETTECTVIDSIPIVISQQGVYCFKSNLSTGISTGNAIDIQTNNVTIDFNGFKLGNLAAGPTSGTIGIYAFERNNIVLTNGNIRGFLDGISLQGGDGHLIYNNIIDSSIRTGILFYANGVVEKNRISNIQGTTDFDSTGIRLRGNGGSLLVRNNAIHNISAGFQRSSYSILINTLDTSTMIDNNYIAGSASNKMNIYYAQNLVLRANVLDSGSCMFFTSSTATLKDNILQGCTQDYISINSTLIDAGGNYPLLP